MQYLEYLVIKFSYSAFSLIPFNWLYLFSDGLSIVLQKIVKYRVEVVNQNLQNAFPTKSKVEIEKIAHQFYKELVDNFLESIKGFSTSTEELLDRYHFLNPQVANQYYDKGSDIIIALSHYGNWEWATQVASTVYNHQAVTFYKPMSNTYLDKYFQKLRNRRGLELLSVYKMHRLTRNHNLKPKAYFMVSDQSPINAEKAYWTTFLNQDTACIRGVETYAKLYNLPVLYMDIQKVKRGFYTIEMEVLFDNPSESKPGEITERYMKKLEQIVIQQPVSWLWSHRRWKLKKSA